MSTVTANVFPFGVTGAGPYISECDDTEDPAAAIGEAVIDCMQQAAKAGFTPGKNEHYVVLLTFKG